MLQPQSQPQSQQTTPAYLLRVGSEFDTYHQARLKRCRLVKPPLIEGNRVRLTIVPVTQPYDRKRIVVTYGLESRFQVYPEPYVCKAERTSLEIYIADILHVLSPTCGPLTARQILDRCKAYKPNIAYRKVLVVEACNELVRRGALLKGSCEGVNVFRLPLPKDSGFPVVELPGKRSERIGWIVAWKGDNPIVRWLEPGYFCSLSHEGLLQPLTDRFKLQQIKIARDKLEQGLQPPIPVPELLLQQLYQSLLDSPRRTIYNNSLALIEIASVLGLRSDSRPSLSYNVRSQTISYLDLYYPNWRKGSFC